MAFNPKFTISSKLAGLISEIAVCREKILSLKILPKRQAGLVRRARLRIIHSSTAIEGNPLGLREVEAVLEGKMVAGVSDKDRLEVVNYEKVMAAIDQTAKKKNVRWENEILKIHRLTTRGLLPPEKSGHYRKGPVFVIRQPTQKILYRAPAAAKVPELMKDFCVWIDSRLTAQLSPVITAAICHHQLVTIHPFTDGNGRVARALATLLLYQKGYDVKKMFALDDYYNRDRPAYYQAIRSAGKAKDLSFWLEYFSQGLLTELEQVLEQTEHFGREVKGNKSNVYLSKRQLRIIDFVAINGKVFRSDVVDIAGVSPKTAYRELEFLRKSGLLTRKSRGPSSHYVLVAD
jgi:Fic family protein